MTMLGLPQERRRRRHPTPTVFQMEAVECGAATLGMVLGYYGRHVPLEELRRECGVSRDGAKASSVVAAARRYGLVAKGFQMEAEQLADVRKPAIIYWAFQHFMVLEGFSKRFGKKTVAVNDPATGPRRIDWADFDSGFTGVVLTFEPGPEFRTGGHRTSVAEALLARRQPMGRAALLVLIASLLLIVPGLATPAFTRVFIDDILAGSAPGYLLPLLAVMLATVAVLAVCTALQRHYMLRIEISMGLTSGARFVRHLLRLPVEFFLQRQPADLQTRVSANNTVAEILSRDLAATVVNLTLVVFYAALLVYYDPVLGVIGVAMALLNIAVLRWVARKRMDAVHAMRNDRGKLSGTSFNTIRLIETIKATGGEQDAFARWGGYLAKVVTARQRLGVPTAVLTVVPPLLAMTSTGLILLIGGLQVARGALSLGILVAFQVLLAALNAPVTQLTNLGERLQDISADLTRLRDVEKYPEDRSFTAPHLESGSPLAGALEFENVSFGYNPLARPVVADISFTVPAGGLVALVGRSGSGKSTLGKLAAGLYAPWSGEVRLDGCPRERLPRETVASSVSYVAQDMYLFRDTVRNNLTLWDDSVSDDDIVQALRDADVYDVIGNRPGGIYSMVAEGGRNFSGGQRQRLELARALVSRPSLLILDEATSALDPETERRVADSLRRRGCGCLIMAHRLSTVRAADEILVVDNGAVVERGGHRDLLALDGHYAALVASGNSLAGA